MEGLVGGAESRKSSGLRRATCVTCAEDSCKSSDLRVVVWESCAEGLVQVFRLGCVSSVMEGIIRKN